VHAKQLDLVLNAPERVITEGSDNYLGCLYNSYAFEHTVWGRWPGKKATCICW